mgnify:CR=1 FL=1
MGNTSKEKTVKENGEKIPSDLKQQVESALAEARKQLESKDTAALQKATEDLTAISNKVAEQIYKGAAGAQGGAGLAGQDHGGEKVRRRRGRDR